MIQKFYIRQAAIKLSLQISLRITRHRIKCTNEFE